MPREKIVIPSFLQTEYEIDDAGYARRFIDDHSFGLHKGDPNRVFLRYCPTIGWIKYDIDGSKWEIQKNKEESKIMAYEYIRQSMDAFRDKVKRDRAKAESQADTDPAAAQKLDFFDKLKLPTKNNSKIKNILEQAAGHHEVIVQPEDLDKIDENNPLTYETINTPCGLINLRTGEVLPHDPSLYLTKCTAVNPAKEYHYDSNGHCQFLDVINSIFPDKLERDWVQKHAGYSLLGIKSHQIFVVFYGTGGNGKTTFLNLISDSLGPDYVKHIEVSSILGSKWDDGGKSANPGIASLKGARIGMLSESAETDFFDAAQIKSATGNKEITARFIHGNPITFRATHELIFDTNHIPRLRRMDEGFYRRFIIVPFTQVFSAHDNTSLEADLGKREILEDCLKWQIDGAISYFKEGLPIGKRFELLPPIMADVLHKYYGDNDYLLNFLRDCCVFDPEVDKPQLKVGVGFLYDAFSDWYKENYGNLPPARKTFQKMLLERSFTEPTTQKTFKIMKSARRADGYYYLGIDLR